MKKIIEKYWKVLVIFIGIPLVLILLSYVYVRIGYKKPIFTVEYLTNKIANGTRYDGVLFTTIYCKDGTSKVGTRFNKYTCSNNRIFTDGYYINDKNVKISKDIFDKYLLDSSFIGNTSKDIDDITQEDYDGILDLINGASDDNLKSYTISKETSDEGYFLVVESKSREISCLLGTNKNGNFILADYVDGKCVMPENIADYLKDESVSLVDTLKDKITCQLKK